MQRRAELTGNKVHKKQIENLQQQCEDYSQALVKANADREQLIVLL